MSINSTNVLDHAVRSNLDLQAGRECRRFDPRQGPVRNRLDLLLLLRRPHAGAELMRVSQLGNQLKVSGGRTSSCGVGFVASSSASTPSIVSEFPACTML